METEMSLRRRIGRIRTYRERRQRLDNAVQAIRDGTAVLIYTMGKVGTTSLRTALLESNFTPVAGHGLDPARIEKSAIEAKDRRVDAPWIPRARAKAQAFVDSQIVDRPPMPIITAARDPGARVVSAFFEILPRTDLLRRNSNPDMNTLTAWFRRPIETLVHPGHPYTDLEHRWFIDEMQSATGIDVYETKFNRRKGCSEIEMAGQRLLILRLENREKWDEHVHDFLGFKPTMASSNRASDKKIGPLYATFKQQFQFTKSELHLLYNSQYARHFYTDAERKKMRARWEANGVASEAAAPIHSDKGGI